MVDKRIALVAIVGMHQHSGFFVGDEYVFVLVCDPETRRKPQKRFVPAAAAREFIGYIQRYFIAVGKEPVFLCALAVELYPLGADIFIQQ